MDSTLNIISLCSGIGGLDEGLKLAMPNARTICYCERDAFPISVLVDKMERGIISSAPIWTDLLTFPYRSFQGITDGIIGGYPCQPFSSVGFRKAEADERHLWPYIRNLIELLQPSFCFFENVYGHISLGFENVAKSLLDLGYKVNAGIFTAAEAGGAHIRKRLYILVYTPRIDGIRSEMPTAKDSTQAIRTMGSSDRRSLQMVERYAPTVPFRNDYIQWKDYGHHPLVPRGTDGFSDWLHRARALGNAVMPQQAALAFRTLVGSI